MLSNYLGGDQIGYRKLYEALKGSNFFGAIVLTFSYVGGSEPIYAFIAWFGSNIGLEKDLYFSIINSFFCAIIIKYLYSKGASFIFIFLMLSNYYIIVLMTSAERLKIAIIIMFIALIYQKKTLLSNSFKLLSIMAHFQIAIYFFSISFLKTINILRSNRVKKKILLIIPIIIAIGGILVAQNISPIIHKISVYAGSYSNGLHIDLIRPLILITVYYIATKKKTNAILVLISLLPFYYLFGGNRINILLFFLIVTLFIEAKKINHPLLTLIMFYYSFKGFHFAYKIFLNQNGYF